MPGLASVLTGAGLNVMGDGIADTKSTIDLLRAIQKNNQPFVIIAAIDDPSLRSWATLHASMNVPVLIARSEIFTRGDNIPQSRIIDLPCTVNEIMAHFGATLDARYGDVEIGRDGRIVSDTPATPKDPFDVFGALTPPQSAEAVPSTPVTSQHDGVFDATPPPPSIFATPLVAHTVEVGTSDIDIFAKNEIASAAPDSTRDGDEITPATDLDPTDIFEVEPEISLLPTPARVLPLLPVAHEDLPTVPTPPTHPEVFLAVTEDHEGLPTIRRAGLTESLFTRTRPTTPTNERRAKVVCVFAGKGGVGKSTSMLSLAERAATVVPGLRVIAIDANRGQGDMRTFLKLDDAGLPSIYDVAVSRNPDVLRDVLINPKRLSNYRTDHTPLHVGVILSPEKDQSDPSVVTSQVYARAIEYARTIADLVLIDTQIVESFDTSGLIDDVIVPLLLDGAWGLGLSDSSTPGVQNLMWVLSNFVERGVSTSRLMVALNKVAPDSLIDAGAMSQYVRRYATWMGVAATDPLIERALNLGEMPGSSGVGETPEFTALLDRVLHYVTGIAAFSQIAPEHAPPPPPRFKSTRLLGWRRR
jgi:MinD-like ATPase involved in chromosome partitioning or flagellar assembly